MRNRLKASRLRSRHPASFCFLLFLLGILFLSSSSSAAERAWFEIRSPHFRVLTNGSEKEGRRVAREFEQMRRVFGIIMPNLKLDAGAPLTVVAVHDEGSAKSLLPEYWKATKVKPAGLFSRGWEKSFAIVRLDVLRDESMERNSRSPFSLVYHEYTHAVMAENFRWLPTWLDEGFAEFYGYTRFANDKTYVGAPGERAAYTRGATLIPLERLLEIKPGDRELQEEQRTQVFYSQSWALVHYLTASEDMERGTRLQRLLSLISTGSPVLDAFRQAIGDPRKVHNELESYMSRTVLDSLTFKNSEDIKEEGFSAQRLDALQTGLEVSALQLWFGEAEAAQPRLDQTLASFPDSAAVHEMMALFHLHKGEAVEATKEFQRALQLDPKRYISVYYGAMMSPAAKSESVEGRAPLQSALNRVLDLNPKYAPAYVQLAFEHARNGALEPALAHAIKARELEPSRAGYTTLVAHLLHRLGRNSEAAAVARFTAERWIGIDRDEAVALWQKLPEADRQGPPLTPTPVPPNTREISGKITSVTCDLKAKTKTVVLDGGTPMTFSTKEAKSTGGLSDTIWAGADHFSSCHNLEGLRAFLAYWPASPNAKVAGELARFEIRRDLPEPIAASR